MKYLRLHNHTAYLARYWVCKGEQVIAIFPVPAGAVGIIPDDDTHQLTAMVIIEGKEYVSAPLDLNGAACFLAEMRRVRPQGAYEFSVVRLPSTRPDQLQFQKTTLGPVTYTISRNGWPIQTVVVSNSAEVQTLAISDTFTIYAVINGITTDTVTTTTTNANAAITATVDTSNPEFEYFTLDVSCDASAVEQGEGDGMIHDVEAVGVPVDVSVQDGRVEATPAEGSV